VAPGLRLARGLGFRLSHLLRAVLTNSNEKKDPIPQRNFLGFTNLWCASLPREAYEFNKPSTAAPPSEIPEPLWSLRAGLADSFRHEILPRRSCRFQTRRSAQFDVFSANHCVSLPLTWKRTLTQVLSSHRQTNSCKSWIAAFRQRCAAILMPTRIHPIPLRLIRFVGCTRFRPFEGRQRQALTREPRAIPH
jgi:hypothetical protein